MRYNIFISTFFLFFLCFSCTTVRVPCKIIHPADVNMSKYKQLAVDEFKGKCGHDAKGYFKEKLTQSDRFTVVDRAHLDKIQTELSLSQSGASDNSAKLSIGKLITASAIISGHISCDYDENITSEDKKCTKYDPKTKESYEYSCIRYKRYGTYRISGDIDVIDVETGRTISTKTLKTKADELTSKIDGTPEPIDKGALKIKCMDKLVSDFAKTILPWTTIEEIPYKKASNIPALEIGINKVRIGEMDEAIQIFLESLNSLKKDPKIKPKDISVILWDLGLTYEYSWQFDKAIEAFKEAYILNPDDNLREEIENVYKLKEERKKLEEQGEMKK
ncbi:MAG: tetratricopeptide repeat protein [Desulfobacterales bacterium]|nr:tetratricopeptide repeat protein [Desulfobacterales bacterium]